jgi:hypothetical protein
MEEEMRRIGADYVKRSVSASEHRPRQLAELDTRIERLRERQRSGKKGLTPPIGYRARHC